MEDLPEVEKALANAIIIDSDENDLNMQIVLCGLLYFKGQINNAIINLTLFLLRNGFKSKTFIFNELLSFLFKEKSGPSSLSTTTKNINFSYYDSLSKKHWEAVKIQKLRSLPPEELFTPPSEIEEDEEKYQQRKKESRK